jgi:hypothetical protein
MKKRVSAELISIAHRILKLKNHSETLQLQQEAKNLYDQLTILRFYEENFEMLKNEIPATVIEEMLEAKPTAVFSAPVEKVVPATEEKSEVAEVTLDEVEALETPIVVTTEAAEEEEVAEATKEIIPESKPEKKFIKPQKQKPVSAKQISFEDMLVHDYKELDFIKVDDVPAGVEMANDLSFDALDIEESLIIDAPQEPAEEKGTKEEKSMSLNDTLNKGINIGLNDRIAFEKKLFGGNSDDFNRVLSQLNSFDSFEEAKDFIQDFVKPDYNNWEGNEEFETRFLDILEKKFN